MAPTSSCDPLKLRDYSTLGLAMLAEIRAKADVVHVALEALRPHNHGDAAEFIPSLEGADRQLYDLLDRWEHLDSFAGDVAAGFMPFLDPTAGPGFVVTVADSDLPLVGWADRDEAIAAAEELAGELQQLMEDLENGETLIHDPPDNDGMSISQMETLAALTNGRGDPAFAVAFVEAMGVNGMVGLRGLYRDFARQADEADRPRDGYWTEDRLDSWVDQQMAPAAGTLSLAMTTRTDPNPESRLDDDLVRRFERYGGEEQADYGVLVKEADLPADVLVEVGNNHLLGGGPSSGNTGGGLDILDAIAANPDASVGWLASDGIQDGTHNIELVLTYGDDVHGSPESYDHFADVVEAGLTHPTDAAGRGELMREAISVVGTEGDTLWNPPEAVRGGDDAATHMRTALAAGVESNMDVVDHMINDDWADMHLGQEPPPDASATHDFLRELMSNQEAATRVSAAVEDYTMERITGAPPPGVDVDGDNIEDRTETLRAVGAVQGVAIGAESNVLFNSVEDYMATQEMKADAVNFAVGLFPYAEGAIGTANDLADVYGLSLGELGADVSFEELNSAENRAHMLQVDSDTNNAVMLAVAAHPERATVPVRDMSAEERQAFIDWVRATNPFEEDDQDNLGMGSDRARGWFVADRWEDD